ncbi:histone acetyltransferase [Neisseria meningitidis]|uniref:histone acetyltransferase n=1 Tax=Neisseria meningitidis TaxID=487 RepID=UPI001F5DF41E
MIELKLVDESSFQAVLDLKISEADERARFVAPNVRSLADAWLYRENEDVFPRAIYWDKQVVGFLRTNSTEPIHLVLQHLRESFSLS